jgi:osmoprotectant transport system permease protein
MREANLRAGGSQGAASTDSVARWIWEKVGGK